MGPVHELEIISVLSYKVYYIMYFSKDGKADGLKLNRDILSLFEEISDAKRTAQFSLKVVINRQKTKVLFAVADGFFADVLLSFLTLPLGTIVRVLKERYGDDEVPVVGSLGTLYDGVADLDSVHFETKLCKHMLLNPRNSSDFRCQKLRLNIDDSPWLVFDSLPYLTFDPFTISTTSFIISDDLRMVPQVGGLIQTLTSHGIADTDGVELRYVTFGYNEIMDILRESVHSHTSILSKVVLNNKQTVSATKSDLWAVLLSYYQVDQNEATSDSEKMILRVVKRKSTNEFLFAQADKDFVDFLLSFLTIPLGEVVRLLDSNTRLKSIDNLHTSLTEFVDFHKYLHAETKDRLIEPKLAAGYFSKNQILPLSEDKRFHSDPIVKEMDKVEGKYVRGLATYMVTDDLTVTPYCITNAIYIINGMDIPLSDVKEVDLHIGLAEALSLLKASLTTTRALSNGLRLS